MSADDDFAFGDRASTLAEEYYPQVFQQFGIVTSIERFPPESERHILDREFAIDTRVHIQPACESLDKLVFTIQEKFRRPRFQRHQDITIEYFQNRYDGEEGDFFKLAVDYYVYGYADHPKTPSRFLEFYVLKFRELKELLAEGLISHNFRRSSSRANMIVIPIPGIPESVFLFSEIDEGTKPC